jgi:hypothetical protein
MLLKLINKMLISKKNILKNLMIKKVYKTRSFKCKINYLKKKKWKNKWSSNYKIVFQTTRHKLNNQMMNYSKKNKIFNFISKGNKLRLIILLIN